MPVLPAVQISRHQRLVDTVSSADKLDIAIVAAPDAIASALTLTDFSGEKLKKWCFAELMRSDALII